MNSNYEDMEEQLKEQFFYRREQEEFVSNHVGSNPRDIVLVILPNICSIILVATSMGLIGKYLNQYLRILLELLLVIVPCVLCCTILSEHAISVSSAMILLSIGNVILMAMNFNTFGIFKGNLKPLNSRRHPFITNFRSVTNVISIACILAVDFKIFPRRFVKTEIYGYSLMDTGVGLFMLANALVDPEARNVQVYRASESVYKTLRRNLQQSVKGSAALLILAYGRYLAVELIGYQRHVSEYGIHWNFFGTLALVRILVSIISSIVSAQYSLLTGILVLTMHEYALSGKELKIWILSDGPRNNFFSANREGLLAIPGYVALYFFGIAVGRIIHSTYKRNSNDSVDLSVKVFGFNIEFAINNSMVLCIKLSVFTIQACTALLLCDSYFQVSRRLANSGYCVWILTLGVAMLSFLILVDVFIDILVGATVSAYRGQYKGSDVRSEIDSKMEVMPVRNVPEVFEAVNYNGLFFFILGNLMTGGVNLITKTLYVNDISAIQILILYMFINLLVVTVLYKYKIQIKF
ncbi:uncharacterized protein At4g17910-like [Cephus cinctus]|uniref:Phosphatidylinositol-glycan biosynthesis class W protein n=1 Tax=Cephus cinctus TaxID=211228 RepID=A0AAJ7RQM9_CEPCN|nr:uncharacterized protein At4g17910-like [Cephus cinctus]